MINMKNILLFVLAFTAGACAQQPEKESSKASPAQKVAYVFEGAPEQLSDYWYQGEAEISRYELLQNRYGSLHPGEAVMVFVTEDFLTDKQVKNERYQNPNSTPVLKMNALRKFPTGIYDYSIMTSAFTPVKVKEFPQTLKVSTSAQEWCGHVYMQANFRDGAYRTLLHSYFEAEADEVDTVPYAILEDELYNRIRMNPEGLPTGKLRVLPSTVLTRLLHRPFLPMEAQASLSAYEGEDFSRENLRVYRLEYPEMNRTLEIVFQAESPYIIEGWTDAYPSLLDEKVRKSIARRTNTIMSPYWLKNAREDMVLRKELGMDYFLQ